MLPDLALRGVTELLVAQSDYQTARDYYEGTVPEPFASPRLRQLLQSTGDKYRINFAATPVDVRLERMLIESASHPSADMLLETIWHDNELEFESLQFHRNTLVFGDHYTIAWPDDTLPSGISIYGHDPRNVRLLYDRSAPRRKVAAVQVWADDADFLRLNYYTTEGVYRYISSSDVRDGFDLTYIDWLDYAPEEGGGPFIPNVVPGIIPVFHFRTDRPYGRPVHKDAFGPQDMLNKLLITLMAAVDYAGFPQRYVLTDSGLEAPSAEADFGPLDGIEGTPDEYHGVLDTNSRFEASPGSTWLLGGTNLKVGQFNVANSNNFLRPATSIIQMMATVTDTPMHYFSLTGDAPSGESYRAANGPLDRAVQRLQASIGATWVELLDYCLSLSGISPGSQILWKPVEHVDDLAYWQTQQVKIQLGLPIEEAFAESGYLRAQIDEWGLGEPETGNPSATVTPDMVSPSPGPESEAVSERQQ